MSSPENQPPTNDAAAPQPTTHFSQIDIEKILLVIIKKFLLELNKEHAALVLTMTADLDNDLGIDSLGRVELFQRIQKEFAVYLPSTLLAEAKTVQDLVTAIEKAEPALEQVKRDYIENLTGTTFDPSEATTLNEVLSKRAEYEPDRPHIYLQDEQGNETVITYGELYDKGSKVAMGLAALGIKPADTVAIMLPTSSEFFYAFWGVLLIGAIPVPIYPPYRPDRIEEYALREANILKTAQVRVLITFQKAEVLSKILKVFISSLNTVTTIDTLLQHDFPMIQYNANAEDGALIQFTSGSTSAPKGVYLKHANLLANIRAIGNAIQIKPSDACVSWLPLYHDMGLIGTWLTTMYFAIPITILSPMTFLSRPESWLWAMHYHRATYSAAPNFAYELCINKIDDAALAGLDLSKWRLAFNGAEAVNPKTLERFSKKFAPYRFKAESLFPVYGLAENTVALLFPPQGRLARVDYVAVEPFKQNQKAIIEKSTVRPRLAFVACGSPLPEHDVRLVDDNMHEVPERTVGRLQFRGPSAMSGYYQNPVATKEIYFDGWWDSGDLAYQADGEIFITGRKKDIIIKAGRNYYPEEIEEVTAQVNGVRKGCVVAFGVPDPKWGTEQLVIVAETKLNDVGNKAEQKKLRNEIITNITEKVNLVAGIPPDQIVLVAPHTIPKTSSGKLQRSAARVAFMQNKLGKRNAPIWLQLSNIFVRGIGVTTRNWLSKIGEGIYTFYVGILFLLSVPPMLLLMYTLPQKLRASAIRYWAKIILFLAAIRVEVHGKENLNALKKQTLKSVVYVANHSSYVDSAVLASILPPGAIFIAKKQVLATPILSTFIKKLNSITVDRYDISADLAATESIINVLQNNQSIVIYPEGTFTYATGLRPFKLGAFKVAAATASTICPIAIQGSRRILRDNEKLMRPGKVTITIGKPLIPRGDDWQEITRLHTEARKQIAQNCGEPTLGFL